jgi:hypothetical protein
MVAAVLTIAGYSINDKIVVFDRIRSGLRDRLSGSVAEVMNTSINETLSRTILTGGTVLLTVLALVFLWWPCSKRLRVFVSYRRHRRNVFVHFHRVAYCPVVDARERPRYKRASSRSDPTTTTAGRLAPRS